MVKKRSSILIALLGALALPLTAAASGRDAARPQWQTIVKSPIIQSPTGLAIDQRGRNPNKWMYTADAATGDLLRLGTGGHYLGRWSYGPKPANPYVLLPAGVAVGGQGNVFVADAAENRVEKFYPPYGLINQWGTPGSGPGQFNRPEGIAVDRTGNIYVADTLNLRIQEFSPAGSYLTSWPMPWIGGQNTSEPTSLAVGPGGSIFAIGNCPARPWCNNGHFDSQDVVVKFSPAGAVLREWVGGTPHNGVGPQEKPWITPNAITLDGAGNWYVTGVVAFPGPSWKAGVLEFSPAGALLHRWRVPDAATPQGIGSPQGIALDPRGSVYVTQGAQILKLTR
jgi:DNA-binding beta-propeller fold protein YncE